MLVHHRLYDVALGFPLSSIESAVADGASVIYGFSEASGSVINLASPDTYDLIYVNAQVVRDVSAPGLPDREGVTFPGTAQAWPDYGYARGFGAGSGRPSQATYTRVAHEIVLRMDALSQSGKIVVHGQAFGGVVDAFRLDVIADDHLRFQLPLTIPLINTNNTAGLVNEWHHYLWQYNGTDFQVFIDGVLAFDETTAIGSATLYDVVEADCIMNFGGGEEGSLKNAQCSVAFWASYANLSLSPAQVAAHAQAAGV